MTLTTILLNPQEKYITYLDPERASFEETQEAAGVATVQVQYYLDEDDNADELFKLGNKLWIQGDNNLKDCLYVLNTKVREDIDEHYVEFEAEEVLVELNYAPPASQTDINSSNFNMNNGNVIVDRKALEFWFGKYFNIGTVQNCLSTALSRINFTGTYNLMTLLRYIEEETGNRFVTQYEKDPVTNIIHRYLNFLNPTNQNVNWSFKTYYQFPVAEENAPSEEDIGEYDSTDDETDYDENVNEVILSTLEPLDPMKTFISFYDDDHVEINHWLLHDIGVTGDEQELGILVSHTYDANEYHINCQINSRIWSVDDEEYITVEGEVDSIAAAENLLPEKIIMVIYNPTDEITYFKHSIIPILSKTHPIILDLGYNVEDLNVEIDETNTFKAVAPLIEANTTEYTTAQIKTITQNWKNLAVNKGDTIPMIIEKITDAASSKSSTVNNNYWSRCIHNQANEGYDYWHGTAYWTAPFTKNQGDMWIEDGTTSSIQYGDIHMLPEMDRNETYPKTDFISTSEENVFEIYNALALHLKEIRYPEIKVETEVAHLSEGRFNDYNIYDKVYVKLPGREVITATVSKTEKKAHEPNENKVELDNYSINTKHVPQETYFTGSNISYTYPAKGTITLYLKDITTDQGIGGKLCSLSVYQIGDNNAETYITSFTGKTNSNGKISYTTGFLPGEYVVQANFGGDDIYEASKEEYHINVGGTVPVQQETSTSAKKTSNKTAKTNTKKNKKTKTVKVKRYYTRYGLSPDKKHKYICAIGKPSASGEKDKYGYKFWKTVFYNKCPACGKASLYWGIFWAGNESANWGKFPATGRSEGGSAEGHIFCKHCDADYSVFGKSHDNYARKLKVYKKPVRSSRTEAYKLKKGKLYYDTITKTVKQKKNSTTKTYTPKANISKAVREKAVSVAKGKTGKAAAKLIANWVQTHIKYDYYYDFKHSAASVLKRGKANCCDQARLMLEMCDAVGVSQKYKLQYVYVCCGRNRDGSISGHVFGQIGGTYADPCRGSYNGPAWGHYITKYGRINKRTTYPTRPF